MGFFDRFKITTSKDNGKLSDQEVFEKIKKLENTDLYTVDFREIKEEILNISDQSILGEIAKMEFKNDFFIYKTVINKITDNTILESLVMSDIHASLALEGIYDDKILLRIVETHGNEHIKEVAKRNASVLMNKKDISPAEAKIELKNFETFLYKNACIKRAIDIKDSVDNWNEMDKSLYYYFIANAISTKNANDERQFPFYAAALYYNPLDSGCWQKIMSLDKYKNIPPHDSKSAQKVHKELPLPKSFEELLD